MSDEKRKVLEMLEAGRITQQDAVRLLEALGETPQEQEPSQRVDPVPNSGAVPGSAPLPKVPAPQQDEATGKIPGAPSPEAEQGSSGPQGEGDASWQSPDRKPGSGTDWSSVFEGLGASMDAAVNEAGQAAEVALREAKKVMSTAAKEAKEALKDGSFLGVVWPKAESASQPEREDYTYQTPVGGPVKSLRIEWVKGSVELIPWEGDTIRVAEYAAKELTQENRMDLREKNGKLTIRWSREDAIFGKLGLKKRLVVEVPRDAFLEEVRVDTLSGWVDLRELTAGRLRVETVSGAVRVWGCVEEASLQTVSGDLGFTGGTVPRKLRLNSVSGRLGVALPQDSSGFTVDYSSVSGRFVSQFPLTGELGGRDGRAVWGDGSARVRMDSVSGALELLVAQG